MWFDFHFSPVCKRGDALVQLGALTCYRYNLGDDLSVSLIKFMSSVFLMLSCTSTNMVQVLLYNS